MTTKALESAQYEVDSVADAIEFYYEKGWTDGLPVVPPTEDKVRAFLDAAGLEPDSLVGAYSTRKRIVTAEKVAINSVMAGCLPEYFPVVLAIMESILDTRFNLHVPNSTTGGAALGFIVNGPIRDGLGMNYRGNVLGPGNRANSTIGRAVRLSQINILGSLPGAGTEDPLGRPVFDRATVGQPGKYTGYHIVENEDDYPSLQPVHVERGFSREQSVVTVFATNGHVQLSAHSEDSAPEDRRHRRQAPSGQREAGSIRRLLRTGDPAGERGLPGQGRLVQGRLPTGGVRRNPDVRSMRYVLRDGRFAEEAHRKEASKRWPSREAPMTFTLRVAGGPAGGFIHYMLPYGGSVISREVRYQA